MKKNVFIFVMIMLCLCGKSFSQIVNMESQRYRTDTTGWSGTVAGNFAITNYGQKVYDMDANAHVQYQTKKNLYLLLGSYGFLKGDGQSFVDYGFLHFRYNHKLGKVVRLEAFTQIQENAITKIQSRILVGAGPRFKLLDKPKFHLYIGSLPMYEIEKEADKPAATHDWRCSSYLSFTYLPNKLTEFTTTTYYQPILFDVGDYRLLNQSTLKLKTSKRLSVVLTWNYQYDATPATDVPTDTYNFSTGLEFDLK